MSEEVSGALPSLISLTVSVDVKPYVLLLSSKHQLTNSCRLLALSSTTLFADVPPIFFLLLLLTGGRTDNTDEASDEIEEDKPRGICCKYQITGKAYNACSKMSCLSVKTFLLSSSAEVKTVLLAVQGKNKRLKQQTCFSRFQLFELCMIIVFTIR